jgi:hypothetical protein
MAVERPTRGQKSSSRPYNFFSLCISWYTDIMPRKDSTKGDDFPESNNYFTSFEKYTMGQVAC